MANTEHARPAGRQQAVSAIVAAAMRLFAARGPDAVSLRQVAAAAGVNYGLVHQYVGTRDDLLRLVFRTVSGQVAADLADAADTDDVLERFTRDRPGADAYFAMLAWAVLQGRDASGLLGRSPALGALLDRMDGPDEEARVRALAATSMLLGWRMFGPFLRAGVGLDGVGETELATALREVAGNLLFGPGAGRGPGSGSQPGPRTGTQAVET